MVRLLYPSIAIYNLINEWLDQLQAAGKSLDPSSDNPITRGDIGVLNWTIQRQLAYTNYGKAFESVSGQKPPDDWTGWAFDDVQKWRTEGTVAGNESGIISQD